MTKVLRTVGGRLAATEGDGLILWGQPGENGIKV